METVYKEAAMTTPQHCPGYEQFKHLKSFVCKCPNCGSLNVSEVSGYCEIKDGSYDKFQNTSLIFSDEPLKKEVQPVHDVWYCISCDCLFDKKTSVCIKDKSEQQAD